MKFIELNKAWTWALIFGFGALILWIYILLPPSETPSFPLENTTPNEDKVMNETNIVDKNQIPFLERIVMLVKYNKTECPDLQVVHANNTFNITTVKDIEAIC